VNSEQLIKQLTEDYEKNESNLCVVLRSGEDGLEALLVADEKGRWSIPGGHVKEGESNAEACKREVKEESGLDVDPQPLLWAYHAARDKSTNLFYALTDQEQTRPGGGDVTKTMWAKLDDLGSLNGTDRLAIHVAANRIHNPQAVVDDAVEVAESQGFAVGTVAAPPAPAQGLYFRINGKSAHSFAVRLAGWAESLQWPTAVVRTMPYESTLDALERASKRRKLTPMLEGILWVADALWRYESVIAPALAQGRIVLESGPEMDRQKLLERGLPPDLLQNLTQRVPQPAAMFNVGEDFDLGTFQAIKDSIEDMKTPGEADAERYWALYNAPMTSTSWAEMDAIKAKFGGKIPPRPTKKAVSQLTVTSGKKWVKGWVTGDAILRELVNTFELPPEEALRLVDSTRAVEIAIDNFKINNADELKQARADDTLEEFWQQAAGELAEDIYGEWKKRQPRQEAQEPPPEHYLGQLTPRQVQVPWKMEFVRDNPDQWDNPIVRCPKCKHEGPLMDDFSYLRAGMGGIAAGGEEDLDAQECGMCGAKMEWNEIADRIVKI